MVISLDAQSFMTKTKKKLLQMDEAYRGPWKSRLFGKAAGIENLLSRRKEMYCIIYIWKILKDVALNFNSSLKRTDLWKWEERSEVQNSQRGLRRSIAFEDYQGLHTEAKRWKTPQKLPADHQRAGIEEGLDEPERAIKFKGTLDKFIRTVLDIPDVLGYHAAS